MANTWPAGSFVGGNQGLAALFRHRDHPFGAGVVRISQVRIRKFRAGHELQLLLDPAAALDGVFQQPFDFLGGDLLIREQQLQKAGHGFAHGDLVAPVEFAVQVEIFVQQMGVVHAPHAPGKFRQTVGNESVFFRQKIRAHFPGISQPGR